MLAVPWYLINTLGKESVLGIAYVIINLISLFWSLYAGTLIDRYNRRNIFVITSIVGGVILCSISALGFINGEMPLLASISVFACTIFIYNIHYPCLYAFAQEISVANDYARVNSILEVQNQLTSAASGAVAAILITGTTDQSFNFFGTDIFLGFNIPRWNLQQVFMLDGITYFISAFLLSFVRYVPVANRHIDLGSVWDKLKTGFVFLKKHALVFLFGVLSFCAFITILVMAYFLLPIYVGKHLHANASVFAIADMCFAFGAVFAGLVIRHLFTIGSSIRGVIILTFFAALIYFMFYVNQSSVFFCFLCLLLGLCNAGIRILRMTYLFNMVPNSVIGRTGGVFNTFNVAGRMFFIGLFSFPFFAQSNNVIYAMLILSVFVFIAGILLLLNYRKLITTTQVAENSG